MSSFTFWIVSPHEPVSREWERLLTRQGWRVGRIKDVEGFVSAASGNSVGIALVDWECLSPSTAANFLRSVKEQSSGISFMLTSEGPLSNDQIIDMLEAGVDDYFVRTIHSDLLLAKLKAHVRRLLPQFAEAMDVLKAPKGDIKLDRNRKEVSVRKAGAKWTSITDLTPTELDILSLFLKRPGAALERSFIIDALWQTEGEHIRPGTVDKHIESLRRKLGKVGSRIRTIYGHGYAYREND